MLLGTHDWHSLDETGWLRSIYQKTKERRSLDRIPTPNAVMVRFTRRGNFTNALLWTQRRDPVSHRAKDYFSVGISKRNPCDVPDALTGMSIALTRGLEQLNEEFTTERGNQ